MMRLRRLDLETFGHFTGRTIDFGIKPATGSDFHIIFGRNEAGKTTLMEGYLRFLYGFPPRDPYAFKHPRANLRVGGVLDIDGTEHSLTRLPSKGGTLIDVNGQPVPEMMLESALKGLNREDYRKLLCLDDETIEKGGEEITKSQGDIGKLLFSAAAGISDLSQVLADVEVQNRDLYLKGGSNSDFAKLKRQHSEVVQQIRDHDISAAAYRGLRAARDDAVATEADLRNQRRELSRHRQRLENIVQAHPLAEEYREVVAALGPISHYPHTLDIRDDHLVGLLTRRSELSAKRDHAAQEVDELAHQLEQLGAPPDILALADALEALGTLKAQVVAGEIDLPRRQGELAEETANLRAQLAAIGVAGTSNASAAALTEAMFDDLQRSRDAVENAQKALTTAQDEAAAAQQKNRDVARLVQEAEADQLQDPVLERAVALAEADDIPEKYSQAQMALEAGNQDYRARLADLNRQAVHFTSTPHITISAAEAQAEAAGMTELTLTLKSAEETVSATRTRWREAQTTVELANDQPDLVDDAAAARTRARRDALWSAHRDALDLATADAFEQAMRAEDTQAQLRARQTGELAEARQARRTETLARNDHEAAVALRDGLSEQLNVLRSRLDGHLREAGLPDGMSAAEFTVWAQAAERAVAAEQALGVLKERYAPLFDQVEALRDTLADRIGEDGASFAGLFKLARARIAKIEDHRQNIKLAMTALRSAVAECARRDDRSATAQDAFDTALTDWCDLVAAHLPDLVGDPRTWSGLQSLRRARETQVRISGLERQIRGITQDRQRLCDELDRLSDEGADLGPIERFAQLTARVASARQQDNQCKELRARLDAALAARTSGDRDLAVLDGQVSALAGLFDDSIPIGSLEDLRLATTTAQTAIDLRAKRQHLTRSLLSLLDVDQLDDAFEVLDQTKSDATRIELAELQDELGRLDPAVDAAIAERSRAQFALDKVGGDDDIALLTEQRRTLEEQMQVCILAYLTGRIGHGLAEEAIRRYRDTHRSGMLAATEQAFSDLTQGAYGRLTTRPADKGNGDVLLAVQTSDGVSKEAAAMSKGTPVSAVPGP